MKKILITGGCGYLGARLCKHLATEGYRITAFDGYDPSAHTQWVSLMDEVVVGDIRDESTISDLADRNFDVVVHLISLDHHKSNSSPNFVSSINVMPTWNLLEHFTKNGLEKFIYFSTFHVYGDCEGTITEETPAQPYHPYASTHRAAEDIVRFYQHYKNINTLTLRLSNAFGCPMDTEINRWALVFNDLCRQAITSRKMIIKSSGKQYRNFISLHDVCAAIGHFLYAIPDQWGDGLYNLGGDNYLSIIEVAEIIAKVYKSKYGESIPVKINDKDDEKKYNPVRFNINKLKKTGFSLSGNMEKEIEKTLSLCESFAA